VQLAPQQQAARRALDAPVPTDPTITRFYEVLRVYGPTIKELIHEEFGDGIMSAINVTLRSTPLELALDGLRVSAADDPGVVARSLKHDQQAAWGVTMDGSEEPRAIGVDARDL
jgi:hypothetical protein